MDKVKKALNNIEGFVCIVLLIAMTVLLFAQVIMRYVIGSPLAWTEEAAIFCLIWLCYFGVSYAVLHRRHMKITMLTDHLSPKAQIVCNIIANFVFMAFCAIVIVNNWELTARFMKGFQIAAATRIPKWIPYIGIPIAFGLCLIRLIQDTFKWVKDLKNGGTSASKEGEL